MNHPETKQLRAELRIALQHAHTVDAERADLAAALHGAKAKVLRAEARTARILAEAAAAHAALAEVRRLCQLTIDGSVRVQAVEQAQDTLAVIDAAHPDRALPGDAAWHSVWLHGNWRWLTKNMTTPEREHAADAVARYHAELNADDPDVGGIEGLRWWRDDA